MPPQVRSIQRPYTPEAMLDPGAIQAAGAGGGGVSSRMRRMAAATRPTASLTPSAAPALSPAASGGASGVNWMPGAGTKVTDDALSEQQRNAGGQATQQAYGQQQQSFSDWGQGIDAAAGFRPTNTAGLSNAVTQWDPNGGSGATGGYLAGRKDLSAGLGDFWGGDVQASTGNLGATNFDQLEGYDPSAALKQYATGAWSDVQQQLGDDLDAVRNRDASLGRLNTGFFDKARGDTITRVMRGYTNDLAGQAMNASAQKLQALSAGGQLRLGRAGQMDSLATQANLANGQLGMQRAGMMLNARGMEDDSRFRGATAYDSQQLDRGQSANAFGLSRANYLDSSAQQAGQFGAQQAGQRAGYAQQGFQNDRDFFSELTAGRQDRAYNNKQADRANKQATAQNIIGGVGTAVKVGSAIKDFFGGAKKGAAIGSVVPGVGTVAGGAIGGIIGGAKKLFGWG